MTNINNNDTNASVSIGPGSIALGSSVLDKKIVKSGQPLSDAEIRNQLHDLQELISVTAVGGGSHRDTALGSNANLTPKPKPVPKEQEKD